MGSTRQAFLKESEQDVEYEQGLVRHMILNSLRAYRMKFKEQYGELVLCCDTWDYWRKKEFPQYKANRKQSYLTDIIDWDALWGCINTVKDELREFFPYKMIEIPHAEADDVIGSLVKKMSVHEPILILSGDKDFVQLQKHKGTVKQFSPVLKKFITDPDPKKFLHELIMKGDRSDGVPNFLSADDTFVSGSRQKQLGKKKLSEWMEMPPKEFCDEKMMYGYSRNQLLIDLDFVPKEIQKQVYEEFDKEPIGSRNKLMNYFIKKGLKNLTQSIGDF
jgi:5'-3' exonuclease